MNRVFKDDTGEIGDNLVLAQAGELSHEGQVYSCPFPDRNGKSFGGGINRGYAPLLTYSSFGKHVGFALKIAVVVQHFQRTQKIV
ncbi:hypothetical protein SDC9_135105 [bioreactor metagenome]|uniref:Uncharacterized protein n=1 Tax=bioreactor metagenome TaxID=1076179 RepID=A0A645DEY0_9ZZZZ